MRLQPSISRRAEADLTSQYHWYRDNAGAQVAEQFLIMFDSTLARLAEIPTLGRPRKFRDPDLAGIRSLALGGKFGAHLIFYRSDEADLSIVRVMHGARDLPRRLSEAPE